MEPNVEFRVYFSHSDSMKECLYVMLLKGSELRQWLIYFLSHTAASNHCSMELLTHPSIMLSRHIISACVCVSLRVRALVWFFFFFLRGLWKQVLKNASVDFLIVSSRDLKTVLAFTSELHPRRASKWNAFSLQPVAWSHIVSQRRSHSNVWTSLPLPGPGRWSFLHGRSCKGTSLWFLLGPAQCAATSVFTWSVSMNLYRASCVFRWQVWIWMYKPGSQFWRWKTTTLFSCIQRVD